MAADVRDRPIRVAHVVTKLALGGAQWTALSMCEGLRARGYDAVLVAGRESDAEGTLHEEAESRGVPVIELAHLGRAIAPVRDVRALYELARFVRTWRPDVVQTHSSKAGVLGRLVCRATGTPVVHTVHGWSFHDGSSAPARRGAVVLERLLAPMTDRFVVVTERDRTKGLAHRIGRPDQYAVVRSGIDLRALEEHQGRPSAPLEAFAPAGHRPVVGTVGRLAAQKDPATFVRVAAKVVEKVPDAQFVWIGDGPARGETERLIAALGVRANVTLAGVRRDVPALLPELDTFLLTSRWEGLPRTIVEAAAFGVPIVATAVDGVPEFVEDGDTGLLCRAGDVDALAAAVLDVLDDPATARERADRARRRVPSFGIDAMVDGLEHVYAPFAGGAALRVTHVISGLRAGGAERALQQLVVGTSDVIDHAVVSLTTDGPIGRSLAAHGVPVAAAAMRPTVAGAAGVFRVRRLVRSTRPDVVQTWLYHADLIGGLAARSLRIPVVWGVRQTAPDTAGNKRHTRLAAALGARLSSVVPARIVCNSEAARLDHVAMGYDASRMVVIPNGVDTDRFRPDIEARHALRHELGLDDDMPLVGLVARFDPQKDHATFMEAAARVVAARPDVHVVLCGRDVPPASQLIAGQAGRVALDGHVHVLGERDDVATVTAALDVAVSSSVFGESFPNAVAEAMACGVAVVATDLPGTARVAGGHALLVPAGDGTALASAVLDALATPATERRARGAAARAYIEAAFTQAAAFTRSVELYRSVAALRSAR